MTDERDPAAGPGLTCTEVLARLSDYLDGELESSARAEVDDHLARCDRCLRFGGAIGALVRSLRGRLDAELPAASADRLMARIAGEGEPT